MKSKDKVEWLPPHLATEYDRLACQLLGPGGKITEKYEKNEETFFSFPGWIISPGESGSGHSLSTGMFLILLRGTSSKNFLPGNRLYSGKASAASSARGSLSPAA